MVMANDTGITGGPQGWRWWRRPAVAAGAAIALILTGLGGSLPPAAASGCTASPVVCENAQTADRVDESQWDGEGDGDDRLQGFATDISVNLGGTISFKVQAQIPYTIAIYRLGYYGGLGARKIASLPGTYPVQNNGANSNCMNAPSTQTLDCGNWAVSASWTVPATDVSGIYVARLTSSTAVPVDGAGNQFVTSPITFVVREDASTSKLLFKTSDATWEAYNTYGNSDFYFGTPNGRSYKLSYNRPFETRTPNAGRDFLYANEYPMLRFLEQNGYDVSYTTDVDTDRFGSLIRNHKVFLSVGHDEYWSGNERSNVEAARDAGVNLAFFSGNEVYWKTRYENSEDGSNTPYRTVVTYKDTWDNKPPAGATTWTGTWRDPRYSPSLDGGRPENQLTGVAYMANTDDLTMQVPAALGANRLWLNTGAHGQAAGAVRSLAPHTIGYESDEDLDNGFRPGGLIYLSATTGETPQYLTDFGSTVVAGTTNHHMTLYRAPSGALVFGAGTIQYAWGLDQNHDGDDPQPANHDMQQFTVNLFGAMGVAAGTLMTGLVAGSVSSDTTAPVATITSPAANTTVTSGTKVTMQGTASDTGGVVAAVEVSLDGGTSWHPATGTTAWSYGFYASGITGEAVKVRAIDDSVNIQPAPATLNLKIAGPYSIFGDRVPANPSTADASGVELGITFIPQDNGYVTGVRFYKGANNIGTHTGSLWLQSSGAQLATGVFGSETQSGWQTLSFSTPVKVTAGTTYVASYFAPNGHYAADPYVLSYRGFSSPPLSVPRSIGPVGSAVFAYGDRYPSTSSSDGNPNDGTHYYVDVVFTDSDVAAPEVVSTSPVANGQYAPIAVHPTATFSKPVNPGTIGFTVRNSTNATVAGSMSYDSATTTATFTPAASLGTGSTYTATVQASDLSGSPMAAPKTWSFTTDQYASVDSLLPTAGTPASSSVDDPNAVEIGVKFVPSVTGQLIGVRFFKGANNTGTHTGSLWSADGTRLATATFTNETDSGWQNVHFDAPVTVTRKSTYVVSYFAPKGHYADTANYFATAVTNDPLTAPAAGNGLFVYGATGGFPTGSYQASNYWVDPLFVPDPNQSPQPSPPPASAVSIFGTTDTPANPNWPDVGAIEVGTRFTADVSGLVYGVKFYKGSQNTGTHTGSLWTADGTRLATGTFADETDTGWQTLLFNAPVAITAGTAYLASYSTTVGYYAVDVNAFAGAGIDKAPLHVPVSGGAYHYGASGFPDGSAPHNYWVDVIFAPNP
jgi:hypothetical protein